MYWRSAEGFLYGIYPSSQEGLCSLLLNCPNLISLSPGLVTEQFSRSLWDTTVLACKSLLALSYPFIWQMSTHNEQKESHLCQGLLCLYSEQERKGEKEAEHGVQVGWKQQDYNQGPKAWHEMFLVIADPFPIDLAFSLLWVAGFSPLIWAKAVM